MIRKKRNITQIDIFSEGSILETEPSFLRGVSAQGMGTDTVLDEMHTEMHSEDFDEIDAEAKRVAIDLHEILDEQRAEPDTNEFLKKDPERLIINRDFADGFFEKDQNTDLPSTSALSDESRARRRWIAKISVIGLLLIAIALLINWQEWVVNSDFFTVKNIDVKGNLMMTKDEIRKLADVGFGGRLAEVDLAKAAERVKLNPIFRSVFVSRNYPSNIVITVQERSPVVFVISDQLYAVDADGFVLPKLKPRMIFNLPVISGFNNPVFPGKKINSEKFYTILEFLEKTKALDEQLYYEISEVSINKEDLYVYVNTLPLTFKIDGEALIRDAVYLSSAIKYFKQNENSQIQQVDLSYNGQILVRRKN